LSRTGRPNSPAITSRFSAWTASLNDHWYPIATNRPAAARSASSMRRPSSTVAPTGFSHSTLDPCASAAHVCGACRWMGVASITRSTRGPAA
jgi:hypothetical protein